MADSRTLLEDKSTTFKLFDRARSLDSEAEILGNMVLRGEEKEVGEVIHKIKEDPILMQCKVVATDPLGTKVHGTLLQIAAMAGDFNLKSNIANEKDRGMVERLIAAGNLSHDEVVEQLQCIHSEKAKRENEERNQRYLEIIKKFGQACAEIGAYRYIQYVTFEAQIDKLEKDLQDERKKEISAGFIFDPKILQIAATWFNEKG